MSATLNNPGNIRNTGIQWQGADLDNSGDFVKFDTPEDGLRAMMLNLQNQQKLHGATNLNDIVSRYAPPSENDTDGYIKFVSDKTGIDPAQPIDMTDKDTALAVTKAMVHREQGKGGTLPDKSYDTAYEQTLPAHDDQLDLFKAAPDATAPAQAAPVAPAAADPNDLLPGTAQPQGSNFKNNPDPTPQTSTMGTLSDQYLQGATGNFADEIEDPIGAGIASMGGAGKYGDLYDQAREMSKNELAAERAQHPAASFAGNIAGSVVGAKGLGLFADAALPESAINAVQTFAKANPLKTAAGAGAGAGALYSAGGSTGGPLDRLNPALAGAGAGMVAGPVGYKLAQGAGALGNAALNTAPGQAVSGGIGKLLSLLGVGAQDAATADPLAGVNVSSPTAQSATAVAPAPNVSILDDADLARLQQGNVLPLTAGDKTQNVLTQRAEQIAMKNGSPAMLSALDQQQQAAQKPFITALGPQQIIDKPNLALRAQQEAENAANILRGQYDSLGGQVKAAYKTAGSAGQGVGISADAIKQDFLAPVTDEMGAHGYQEGDIPNLENHLLKMNDILSPDKDGNVNVTSAKLSKLEDWKKRFNQLNLTSDQLSPATVDMHKAIVNRGYDTFLNNMADDAIVGGDQTAIEAFQSARGLARQKFQFYDADSSVARILDNRSLTGQQLVNTIYGANKLAGKGDDGNLVGTMLDLAGDRAPQMQQAIKQGAIAKVFGDGISETKNPSSPDAAGNLISFQNMKKSLGNLMQQKETFGAIFNEDEQGYFKQMYDDLGKIASKQPGAVNNSSTGSYIADMYEKIGNFMMNPLFGKIPGTGLIKKGLEGQAEAIITKKAEQGLGDFMQHAVKSVDTAPIYYGAMGAAAVDPIGNIESFFAGSAPQQQETAQ